MKSMTTFISKAKYPARNSIFPVDKNAFSSVHAESYLAIPTSVTQDPNKETVHPGVVYIESGWNGYKYWMAHTPYWNTNDDYENPEVCASNDGINWEVPSGTNPIPLFPYPGLSPYHNSDTDIYLGYDNIMYVIYNGVKFPNDPPVAEERISSHFISSSSDGVNWTEGVKSNSGGLSPCVIKDNGKYVLYYVQWYKPPGATNRPLIISESTSPTGPWSNAVSVQPENNPYGRWLWHVDINKEDGQYIAFFNTDNGSDGSDTNLYMGVSLDGVNWTFADDVLLEPAGAPDWADSRVYRGSGVYFKTPYPHFKFWYSCYGGDWHIGLTEVLINI